MVYSSTFINRQQDHGPFVYSLGQIPMENRQYRASDSLGAYSYLESWLFGPKNWAGIMSASELVVNSAVSDVEDDFY